jgi:penicillin-insensitive murein DD-endopeptidase
MSGRNSVWRACLLALLPLAIAQPLPAWDRFAAPAAGTPEAIGSYSAGCVIGAEALPADGEGFQTIQLSRNRYYGHPELIGFLTDLGRAAAEREIGTLLIGDMNQPRGGPMIRDHASHQAGLDADVYFRLDLPRLPPDERESLELPSMVDLAQGAVNDRFGEGQIELLRLAATDARVARIFIHPPIKQALCERDWDDRAFLRTLRPWYGHDRHMHVRLNCPADSPDCMPQPAPPPGDGCGAELASWMADLPLPIRRGAAREPILPARCEALRTR